MTILSLRPVRFQGSPPPPPSASSKPDPATATPRVSSETLPSKAQPAHWQAHAMTSLKDAAKIPPSKPSFQIEPLQPVLTSPEDINEANILKATQQITELTNFTIKHHADSLEHSLQKLIDALDQDEAVKKEALGVLDYFKQTQSIANKLYQDKNIAIEQISPGINARFNKDIGQAQTDNIALACLVKGRLQGIALGSVVDQSNVALKPVTDRMTTLLSRNPQGELTGHVMLQPASLLFDPQGTYAPTDPTAWIHNLLVHTDERQKGLGTALIQKSLETAKEKGYQHALLSVNPKKPWLENWYHTLGFAPVDDRTPETIRDTVRFAQKTVAQSPLAKALDGDRRFLWKSL